MGLRNLLDVAVRLEGMRAAIFAVTLDAKNWVKAIQKILSSAAFKNQTDTRAEYVWVWSMLRYSQHQAEHP